MGQLDYNLMECAIDHREKQTSQGRSHSGFPATTIDQLLKFNRNRTYSGVHESCVSETEIITCVLFKGENDYFHTLYMGPETNQPKLIHQRILEKLNIPEEEFLRNKSTIALF